MKVICFLAILFISASANAFHCDDTRTGASIGIGGGTATVNVTISPTMASGTVTTIFDASNELRCTSDDSSITDIMYLESVTTGLSPSSNYSLNFDLSGSNKSIPYSGDAELFGVRGDIGPYPHSAYFPLVFKITLADNITDPLVIHSGDTIYTLNLRQNSSHDGDHLYTWVIKAANSTYIVTSSCEINGGQQIAIDFGTVQSDSIGTTLSTTLQKRTKHIPVQCTNNVSVTAYMDIYASSTASGFAESNVIATTDKSMGVVISKQGTSTTIPLNKRSNVSFPVTNGQGSIDLDVSLVKKNETATLTGGAFSASATLVLAVD